MWKLSDELIKEIEDEITNGFISKNKHPEFDLYILNHTPNASMAWRWTTATRLCRGLIITPNYDVVARSYPKFFEVSQIRKGDEQIPYNLECEVFEKADGYLLILFFYDGKPYVTTRGRFDSPYAVKANEMLNTQYKHIKWNPKYSYSMELLIPNDDLVYTYNDCKFKLHGIFDNDTGEEIPLTEFEELQTLINSGLETVDHMESKYKFNNFKELIEKYPFKYGLEGYVVRFSNGYRLKIKYDEYKALSAAHQDLTSTNNILNYCKSGMLYDLYDSLPERILDAVKTFSDLVEREYEQWYSITIDTIKDMDKNNYDIKFVNSNAIYDRTILSLVNYLYKYKITHFEEAVWKLIYKKFWVSGDDNSKRNILTFKNDN